MQSKRAVLTVCSLCSSVCICMCFCLSFFWEVREQAPISKAPRHFVTQWAVKMLIQPTHTLTHTQDIQRAGERRSGVIPALGTKLQARQARAGYFIIH